MGPNDLQGVIWCCNYGWSSTCKRFMVCKECLHQLGLTILPHINFELPWGPKNQAIKWGRKVGTNVECLNWKFHLMDVCIRDEKLPNDFLTMIWPSKSKSIHHDFICLGMHQTILNLGYEVGVPLNLKNKMFAYPIPKSKWQQLDIFISQNKHK